MNQSISTSPRWSTSTKAVVGVSIVAMVAALLIQFRNIIGPLILAFILAFLFHPVASWLSRVSRLNWRTAVSLIYVLVMIVVGVVFTLTGLAIVQQLQSLIGFVQTNVTNLPSIVEDISHRSYTFGPFVFDLAQYDLQTLTNQILSAIQPVLGRAGSLLSSLATSAAVTIGWGLFVLVISYFLLADAGQVSGKLVHVELPGYQSDLLRLGLELRIIWNAFLRGQLIMMLLTMLAYAVLMSIYGVHFALGIAILAGLGRFIPYLGPLILWVVTILVTYFQGSNYLGLQPIQYVLLVVISAFIVDQIFDNLINPRFMGSALGVHPAAVLIAAIIAANLIGLIGLLLAAPVVATLNLFTRYISRKMFDLDPFPEPISEPRSVAMPLPGILSKIRSFNKKEQSSEMNKPPTD